MMSTMHEIGIIQSALDFAVETAKSSGASRIHGLKMRVGVMTGVAPESLNFAFEAVREDTLAAEASLTVELVDAAYWCAHCQREFRAVVGSIECPQCHTVSSEMRHGMELELASMEVS
jgi:hydrogenase nickel incorporation protein HypA/HybF